MVNRRQTLIAAGAAMAAGPALGQSVAAPPVKPEHAKFAAEIAAAQACLDAFMKAFNARDIAAYEATFNFPHVRFASGKVTIINPGFHKPEMFTSGALSDWDHSAWQRRDVIHAGADKVVLTEEQDLSLAVGAYTHTKGVEVVVDGCGGNKMAQG